MSQPHDITSTLPPCPDCTGGPAPLNVEIADSPEAFRNLRAQWRRLLENSHSNSVFLTWEWLFTWWKWYGGKGRLFILVVRDADGHIKGIGPLMTRKTLGIFHKLQLIGSESKVCSEYLDIIAEKGWEEHVARSIMRFLLRRCFPWHILVLSSIRGDSPFLAVLRQLSEVRRLRSRLEVESINPFLSYPDTWDELLARFSRKTRRNIRYYKRRLDNDFRVQFLPWSGLFGRTQTVNVIKRLQQKSISRKGFRGVFADPTYRNFHAEIMDLFHKKGWLYIVFLLCDGKPVAFWYVYLYGDRCYAYQTGFDTDYSSYSVGTVLHSYVLQDTMSRGTRAFEYLRGNQRYKHYFANSAREMVVLSIFNNSWSGTLLRLLHTCWRRLKSHATSLPGVNFIQGIKAGVFKL